MADILVTQKIQPDGQLVSYYHWIRVDPQRRGSVDVDWHRDPDISFSGFLIACYAHTREWQGPSQPQIDDLVQIGPYHLQCTGYDAQRDVYTFRRIQ